MISRNEKDDYSYCLSSKRIIEQAINNAKKYRHKNKKKRKIR